MGQRDSRERVTQTQMEAGPAIVKQTSMGMTQGPWVTPWALYLMFQCWGWAARNIAVECPQQTMGPWRAHAGWSRM